MRGFAEPKEYQNLPYQGKLWLSLLSNRLQEYVKNKKYTISNPRDYAPPYEFVEDRLIVSVCPTGPHLVMENYKIFEQISYFFVTPKVGSCKLFGANHKIVGEVLPKSSVVQGIDNEMKRLEYALSEFDRLISRGNDYIDSLPGRDIKL